MNYAVSVTDTFYAQDIEKSGVQIIKHLNTFSESLNELTSFENPRGIVFHDLKSATQIFSDIPLPAYTSRELIHINPLTVVWQDIFMSTVQGKNSKPAEYYSTLELIDVAVIAAHELTHHSEFFHGDFEGDEQNMWFEEGMCFYIPRKLMLAEEKFNDIAEVESQLIKTYRSEYGEYTLDLFGESVCRQNQRNEYSAAFYDYWRSTKVVKILIEEYFKGSIMELINCYNEWDQEGPLHKYFIKRLNLSASESEKLWFQ